MSVAAAGKPGDRNESLLWRWYLGNVAAAVLLLLVPVWLKTALHRFHNYDLGIFSQALHAIRCDDLNPFLPALNLPLFNDHFDPILIVFAPIARLLEPAYAALAVEHVLVLLSPLPILLLCSRESRLLPYACFATTYLLFNRGTVSALNFPVHPTTWAGFFIVVFAAAVHLRRLWFLVLAAVALMACKEEFPFAVAMVGACLVLRRDFRAGVALLVLALSWSAVAFGLRPVLVGETHDYASRVLTPILTDPLTTLGARLSDPKGLRRMIECCLPLVPLVAWQIKNRVAPNWALLSGAIPLLAIRFLDGAWGSHYMAPVTALLVVAFWRKDQPGLPWRYALTGAAITIVASLGPILRTVAAYGAVQELRGPRLAAIRDARMHLIRETEGKALVEGNLTPLLAGRPAVFQIGGVQPLQEYRFLLAEKPPEGNPWPVKHPDIQRVIEDWRGEPSLVVHRDDEFVFFAERAAPMTALPRPSLEASGGSESRR